MAITTLLDAIAIALAAIHFGIPLTYYLYLKRVWLPKPWNLKIDPSYLPRVSIIVPTYNEARIIGRRLDNIYGQDYPRDRLEIVVVDSSTDGTADIVEEWARNHSDVVVKLVRERVRRGKAWALNEGLKHASGEIVVIADADAFWPSNALREVAKWFSDPSVGAVSCLKKPSSNSSAIEDTYRRYYNLLRLAESKIFSTPIFHGELAAFRRELLEKVGGFPTHIGADDSHTATRIASMGYRAITPETLWCEELVPRKSHYFRWRVRRAQHLIQHFLESLKLRPRNKAFRRVLLAEAYLHLANPWTLLAATAILTASTALHHSLTAPLLLATGLALLTIKPFRTWIAQQIHLITATIRNLYTKEIAWSKQSKQGSP